MKGILPCRSLFMEADVSCSVPRVRARLLGCYLAIGVLFAVYYVRSAIRSITAYTPLSCNTQPLIRFLLGSNHLRLGFPVRSNTRHMYQAVQTMKHMLAGIYRQILLTAKVSIYYPEFIRGSCEVEPYSVVIMTLREA